MAVQDTSSKPREFTGWHMLAVCLGAFGTIIAVNLYMAFSAVSTFPGLNVANSYIASQEFDQRRAAQEALGWQIEAQAEPNSLRIEITDVTGATVEAARIEAILGRTTHQRDDLTPNLRFHDGLYHAQGLELGAGRWALRLNIWAKDGTHFEQRIVLSVRG